MQIVFGPILSRRFGVSLGIDLSPYTKQCNFDCVYCELEAKKPMDTQTQIAPLEVVLESIECALRTHTDIDVLTFTANGEPTLYPHLEKLILQVKELLKEYSNIKTLILSNGSRFHAQKNALNHFDIVKFSLDSVVTNNFKRVDKPSKTLDLATIKQGIKDFSKQYSGELVAEVLVVANMNDDIESNRENAAFLREVDIKRVDISTIDRPSSHRVYPVSNEKLYELSTLYEGLNVCVVTRKNDVMNVAQQDLSETEILELLKRRPLTHVDCEILLTKESVNRLESMYAIGQIKIKNIAGVSFYCV
ncbi:radical SAM protein [Helicobacter bilis]|uniref:Radical SAM protein n=1 Tax=Helicobacter bilis TaxID=37372 RepID=A0A4V6I631_9HELI|nr:radical SAM protein [Helicobacter bilis]MCI7411611.1 radical SAM protein [Helicobacter bilis]MDD7295865.1 radical SAM protein [Helicobacter bilis]MDY4400622.1 radical SAM protein [Helicobacter bilis]TLE10599.1 radical SAM protein [Helicobacter bilis]